MRNIEIFKQYVLEQYPKEACGYVEDEVFYAVENVASDPVNFFLFPEEISFTIADKDVTIIHSHTMETWENDPRTPSLEDMIAQKNTGHTFGIVHTDGTIVSDILYFGPPQETSLIGRKYLHNVNDCFTIARDFYWQFFNIDIGINPRKADWEEWNPNYILQNYIGMGFSEVSELQFGDALLFCISSTIPNHIGIYLDNDRFVHHLYRRTSEEDSLQKWKRQLVKILRHKDVR